MQVCIHRGSKQIGGSCVELKCDGQRLLLDLGLPLDADGDNAKYLPNVQGLDGSDPSLLGILISHPHLDHFGLLGHVASTIPVGLGPAARRILMAAAPFLPGERVIPAVGWDYVSGKKFQVGPFSITPYLVDHSAYDSYALLIECSGKTIFYSGDFRDHGRKSALFDQLLRALPKQIDVMLLEGSSLGRLAETETFPSEMDIENDLLAAFKNTKGMALVHTSIQNIDRIVSIYRASRRSGRKLIIDLYAASILAATGNKHIPQSNWDDVLLFVPHAQRLQVKNNAWFDLLQSHAANRIFPEQLPDIAAQSTLLFRPMHRFDLTRAKCLGGAGYIYSQWCGYWDQGCYSRVNEWLEEQQIPKMDIHTSGHASTKTLKTLVEVIGPKRLVPIHSFYPERYPELFPNVTIESDTIWWDV